MKNTKPQSKSNRVFLVKAPWPVIEFRSVSEERADERRVGRVGRVRVHVGHKSAAAAIRSPLVAALGGIIR